MNKNYSLLLLLLCLTAAQLRGQYIDLSAPFPPPTDDIGYMSAPSANVIWSTGYSSTGPSQTFVRSIDGGQTWNAGTVPTPDLNWDNNSIIAVDANTAWITFSNDSTSTLGAIYKTSDGGITWARQGTDSLFLDGDLSYANWTYFWDANVGVTMGDPVDGYFEFWRTTNGGTTWSRVPSANLPAPLSSEYGFTDGYAVVGDTIWCTTNKGTCLRSIDRGQHWAAFATNHTGYYKIYFQDALHGLSVRRSASTAANNFRSTSDGGATWSEPFTATVSDSLLGLVDAPFFMRHADYVPGSGILVGVGRETNSLVEMAAVSYDGGHTFTSLGLAQGDFSFVQMLSSSSGYVGGSENGVAKVYQLNQALSAVREPLAATMPVRVLSNPVRDQLTIEVLEDLGAKGAFALFSADGRQLRSLAAPFALVGQQIQMPLAGLPAGLYLLKVTAAQGTSTLKVLVR